WRQCLRGQTGGVRRVRRRGENTGTILGGAQRTAAGGRSAWIGRRSRSRLDRAYLSRRDTTRTAAIKSRGPPAANHPTRLFSTVFSIRPRPITDQASLAPIAAVMSEYISRFRSGVARCSANDLVELRMADSPTRSASLSLRRSLA